MKKLIISFLLITTLNSNGQIRIGQEFIITKEGEGKYIYAKLKDHLYFIGIPLHANLHIGKKGNIHLTTGSNLSYSSIKKENRYIFK